MNLALYHGNKIFRKRAVVVEQNILCTSEPIQRSVPEKFIMTGHRDVRSSQRYERPDIKAKV